MAVASSAQGLRVAVNACIAAMLDASEAHAGRAMASTQYAGSGTAISGLDGAGRTFSTLLMDELAGGGGAYSGADGEDSSGTLSSPGALTSNVEVNEVYFPVLYRAKRETPDSGGPGVRRGGVGTTYAYGPHRTAAPFSLAPIASGLQHPCAVGIAGGEPGFQGASVVAPLTEIATAPSWENIAAKVDVKTPVVGQKVAAGQAFVFAAQGGGGWGDPLQRDPALVLEDVLEGLVSIAGAKRDYGVVVIQNGIAKVDEAATAKERIAQRRARIDREPKAMNYARSGRRLSSHLEVAKGKVVCAHCGTALCGAGEKLYPHFAVRENDCAERFVVGSRFEGSERFCVRHFYCPGCATQVDVQVALRGDPPLEAINTGTA
jgi:N-methylhydantoinase B